MKVEGVYTLKRHTWVRLHEKGSKRHEMPCHHHQDAYLHAYIDSAGLGGSPKNTLFPSANGSRREIGQQMANYESARTTGCMTGETMRFVSRAGADRDLRSVDRR